MTRCHFPIPETFEETVSLLRATRLYERTFLQRTGPHVVTLGCCAAGLDAAHGGEVGVFDGRLLSFLARTPGEAEAFTSGCFMGAFRGKRLDSIRRYLRQFGEWDEREGPGIYGWITALEEFTARSQFPTSCTAAEEGRADAVPVTPALRCGQLVGDPTDERTWEGLWQSGGLPVEGMIRELNSTGLWELSAPAGTAVLDHGQTVFVAECKGEAEAFVYGIYSHERDYGVWQYEG